jgi:CRP-like cAMP-binding protein
MQRLLAACPVTDTRAGEIVAIPDGVALLFVTSGVVVSIVGQHRRPFVGFFAGEGDVLTAPHDTAQLQALRNARVALVDEAARAELLADRESADALARALAAAVVEREETLSHLAEPVHRDRVLGRLVQLARKFGRVTPHGVRIELPLTHQLLASAIGAARETVSVALRDLQREGIVTRHGRSYLIALSALNLAAPQARQADDRATGDE